jgi:Rrf2 family protein
MCSETAPQAARPRRRIVTPAGQNATVHVSARADYGIRALLELAVAYGEDPHRLVKADAIASAQGIPIKFLEAILRQLRLAGIVATQRGSDGGYRLDRDPSDVTIAGIVRGLDGPAVDLRSNRPEDQEYKGSSQHLREVWVALRASMSRVLESVTLADIAEGRLPQNVASTVVESGA